MQKQPTRALSAFDPTPVPLRLLVDCIPDFAIFMVDADGRIATWNTGGRRIYGYETDDIVGNHVSMLYGGDPTRLEGKAAQDLAIAFSEARLEEECWHVRKDGGRYWASVIIARVDEDGGLLRGYAMVVRDATERHAAEMNVKHERDRLEAALAEKGRIEAELSRSNRDLQEFAVVASHDLQEPLRKMRMFGDRLKNEFGDKLGETGTDYVDRMQNAAGRGQSLVRGLLEYARVASVARSMAQVNLTEIVTALADDFSSRLTEVGGRIEMGELPTVDAEPLQMRQLFENLIGNAIKFRAKERPLVIGIDASPAASGSWMINVTDNGIGFEPKYVDKIFKMFQRLHERNAYEGAGMGLAICRRIAERHGGKIVGSSTPGEGSSFNITLPAHGPDKG